MDASHARLEKVKDVAIPTKDCINGYIREAQKLFPSDNTYSLIPTLINYWIILYYYVWEHFDSNWCSDGFKLTEHNKLITKIKTNYSNAYLKAVVNTGIHKWKFELITITAADSMIGIWKTKYDKNLTHGLHGGAAKGKYYGWWSDFQCTTAGDNKSKPYSDRRVQSGDIVDMILDFNKSELSYNLNDKPQGIAFTNIEQCDYVVCISLYARTNEIKLLSYNSS